MPASAAVLLPLLPLLSLVLLQQPLAVPASSSSLRISSLSGNVSRQVLQLLLVADSSFVRKAGSHANANGRVQQIVNLANALWEPLQLRLVLQHLVLWDSDPIARSDNAIEMTVRFAAYKAMHLSHRQHDLAILISATSWSSGRHLASQWSRGLCDRIRSVAVMADMYTSPVASWIMAASISHSAGVNSIDGKANCSCDQPHGCVTTNNIITGYSSIEKLGWATCSVQEWRSQAGDTWRRCLRDAPVSQSSGSCGNGVVDAGEACDCGPAETCTSSCCNAATCQLKAGAACASGSCCNFATCQLLPRGTECRAADGLCDLAEACDGSSEWCPADDWKADGVECIAGQAHCYSGQCQSRTTQCQSLFGSAATAANDLCYTGNNAAGGKQGHCHIRLLRVEVNGDNWLTRTYRVHRCTSSNTQCGLLHCQQATRPDNSRTYPVSGHSCYSRWAVDFSSSGLRSPSLVPDGAACGSGRMCVNSTCQPVPKLVMCSSDGVPAYGGSCHCGTGVSDADCVPVSTNLLLLVLVPSLCAAAAALAAIVAIALLVARSQKRKRAVTASEMAARSGQPAATAASGAAAANNAYAVENNGFSGDNNGWQPTAPPAEAPAYPAPSAQAPVYPAPSAQAPVYPAPSAQAPVYPAPSAQAPVYPAQQAWEKPPPSYDDIFGLPEA